MAARPSGTHTLVVHHFSLSTITGVTVMLEEILRSFPAGASATYLSYPPSPAELAAALDAHDAVDRVVGVNLHIEVQREHTLVLLDWCATHGIPLHLWVHDYWPHLREDVERAVARGAMLLASSPVLQQQLSAAGFGSRVVPIGIRIPLRDCTPAPSPPVVASAGRLAPRKRFVDAVKGFRRARLGPDAELYLRLLPSLVFGDARDAAELDLVRAAIAEGDDRGGRVTVDRTPTPEPFDHAAYSAYVCPSTYEGFSMAPIEAAWCGVPPLMSDIPAHRAIARALVPEHERDFLFGVGDLDGLARLLRDEVASGARRGLLAERRAQIRAVVEERWSLARTAEALAALPPARRGAGGAAP